MRQLDPDLIAADNRLSAENRRFAFSFAGGLFFLSLLAVWRQRYPLAAGVSVLAVVAIAGGVLVPRRLSRFRVQWLRLGELLGAVTTPLVMGVLYFGVITPAAIVRRVIRRGDTATGWQRHSEPTPPSRMERQF